MSLLAVTYHDTLIVSKKDHLLVSTDIYSYLITKNCWMLCMWGMYLQLNVILTDSLSDVALNQINFW